MNQKKIEKAERRLANNEIQADDLKKLMVHIYEDTESFYSDFRNMAMVDYDAMLQAEDDLSGELKSLSCI